jgi:hypothetical protein
MNNEMNWVEALITDALTAHTMPRPRKAKDIRKANRLANSDRRCTKVRKAMKPNGCTEGGTPTARHPKHNMSERGSIRLHGVEVFPDFSVGSIQTVDVPCLMH